MNNLFNFFTKTLQLFLYGRLGTKLKINYYSQHRTKIIKLLTNFHILQTKGDPRAIFIPSTNCNFIDNSLQFDRSISAKQGGVRPFGGIYNLYYSCGNNFISGAQLEAGQDKWWPLGPLTTALVSPPNF